MIRKFIIICSLIVATASYATEDCSARLLDDLELSRWNVAAPEILLQSQQNIEGPTNVVNKSFLSAELSGVSDGKWKVQAYETIKKEMFIQDNNELRRIAESIATSRLPICNRRVLVALSDSEVRHDTSIYAGKKYILVQLEYIELDSILNGGKSLDGPYAKKKVYLSRDLRSGAIALSVVGRSIDKESRTRAPTITRFFEIQGEELKVVDDKCSTRDLVYSFANIDSSGNLIVYFGFDGRHAVVSCDKKDILRYSAIVAKGLK